MLFRSSYCSIATRTIPILKCFSLPKLPKHHRLGVLTLRDRYVGVQRRSQCWKKNLACANHPKPQHVSVRRLFSPLTCFSKSYPLFVLGLPPKLRILPPKRKQTTTQAPEPRRSSSFSKGPWETLWGCDSESPESPIEGIDFPSGGFPDCHAEQDSELDHDAVTPTNGASWSSDEELTPLFSSNFPSDANASRREDRPMDSSGNRFLKS